MATAYQSKPLTKPEIDAIATFLEEVEIKAAPDPAAAKIDPSPDHSIMLIGGAIGIVAWFGFISVMYVNRKKRSVKHGIFERQKH